MLRGDILTLRITGYGNSTGMVPGFVTRLLANQPTHLPNLVGLELVDLTLYEPVFRTLYDFLILRTGAADGGPMPLRRLVFSNVRCIGMAAADDYPFLAKLVKTIWADPSLVSIQRGVRLRTMQGLEELVFRMPQCAWWTHVMDPQNNLPSLPNVRSLSVGRTMHRSGCISINHSCPPGFERRRGLPEFI